MDPDVALAKLESLDRCVRRLEEKRAVSPGELAADVDRQDIVAVNLERAVQICVDLAAHWIAESGEPAPQTMAGAFDSLVRTGILPADMADRLKRAVAFRNLAVHQYDRIDWTRVHGILWTGLDDFRAFAAVVLARIKTGTPEPNDT